ncbi:hypothetical protein [Actinoplanes sp. M2I2]|uniref:hypothetical protein n=1 Tax=Actinoplanes sp. M2I2 TaxID=1734444 RepID=UPI00202005A7|nr:hypothetical protein [Actinoplanes sp. M2I2]
MAKKELLVTVRIDGIRETLAALAKLPKEANDELRAAALEISKELSEAAKQAGEREGGQAALVATTVKRRRDRVPVVVAGGTKKLGRNRAPAYKLLFGSEFGANYYEQYRPHLGRGSYWFFQSIEAEQATIAKKWLDAADAIIAKFDGVG